VAAQGLDDGLPDVTAEAGRDLTGLHRLLNSPRTELDPVADEDGRATFERFVTSLRKALKPHPKLAGEVPKDPAKWASDIRELLVRGYLARIHYSDLPTALSELVRLRTVSRTRGTAPDDAFEQLDAWLEARCKRFGLGLKRLAKGRAWSVTIGKGKTRLGLVAHVDVFDATPEGWTRDPWAGRQAGRKVWGRGASGGKAGLVTALYALKAVRDSGLRLKGKAVLLVTTAQQGERKDLKAAGKAGRLPKTTIVTGTAFPLSVGEKGAAVVTVRSAPGDEPDAATQGWRVVEAHGGTHAEKVPHDAVALLDPRDLPARRALGALRRNLTLMTKQSPGLDARIEQEGDYVSVRFAGRTGHASAPELGRNALADLVVFLADYVGVFPDHRGRLLRFLSAHVGQATDGAGLGLRHTHPAMSATTVNLAVLAEGATGPVATLDIRWPHGRELKQQTAAVRDKARNFVATMGGSLEVTSTGTDPVLVDAEAPLVQTLQGVYRQLVRRDPPLRTLARPTYARLIPGAVAFGPAPAGTNPDPEAVDQSMGMEELDLATRVYATSILRLLVK